MVNSDVLIRKFIFDLEIDKQESFNFYNETLSNFVKERTEKIFQDMKKFFLVKHTFYILIFDMTLELGKNSYSFP